MRRIAQDLRSIALGVALAAAAGVASSAEIRIGSAEGRPGDSVTIPLTFDMTPSPASIVGYSIFLNIDSRFPMPSVSPGAAQPNITAFVDFIGGRYRVTGLIFAGANIGDGESVTLNFTIPQGLAPGPYSIGIDDMDVRNTANQSVPTSWTQGFIDVGCGEPLELAAAPNATICAGVRYEANPAVLSSAGDLAWELIEGPDGMTIDAATGRVEWLEPAAGGPHQVTVRATDDCESDEATWQVTVLAGPVPAEIEDQAIVAGAGAYAFTPTLVSGDPPVTWDLLFGPNGMTIDAATGEVAWQTPEAREQPYSIVIRARNDCGQAQVHWGLTVLASPSVMTDPISQTINAGKNFVLGVTAAGSAPLSFSWSKDASALIDGGRISGAGEAMLRVAGAMPADAGEYSASVVNAAGSTQSAVAEITVIGTGEPGGVRAPNSAAIVGNTLPAHLGAGLSAPFAVIVRNTSDLTWSSAQGYALAVTIDEGELVAGPDPERLFILNPLTVVPSQGGEYVFTGTLQAPATPGMHRLRMQMVEELVEFFGEALDVNINVVDPPTATAAAIAGSAFESNGPIVVEVRLSHSVGFPVAVDYATSDGSATAGEDYVARAGTILFEPGATTATLEIEVLDDDFYDGGDETFAFALTESHQSLLTGAPLTLTVRDDEGMPEVFIQGPVSVGEGAGRVQIPVTVFSTAAVPIWIHFETRQDENENAARAGEDYLATQGVVVIEPHQTEATIEIEILDDPLDEGDKTFSVDMTGAVNGFLPDVGSLLSARVTILDDDTDADALRFIETWDQVPAGELPPGGVPMADEAFFAAVGGWGGALAAGEVGFASSAMLLNEPRLRAVAIDGSTRIQRTRLPELPLGDPTAHLGNSLVASLAAGFDDDEVISVTLEARVFIGALTPDGTADFPIDGAEELAPLSTFTFALGAASPDYGAPPFSAPGALAGPASLAFRINNDRTGMGGARPRWEFAVNRATFGDLDSTLGLTPPPNSAIAADPTLGVGEALQSQPGVAGEEYLVEVRFVKLTSSMTEVTYKATAVDGDGALDTGGERTLVLPASFPDGQRLEQIVLQFGAGFGLGDGPDAEVSNAIDNDLHGSWIDDVRVTTFGASKAPTLDARHWIVYR
jgi:hypothetical protein